MLRIQRASNGKIVFTLSGRIEAPENTYFRDDRVKQVVGVKLQLNTGIGYAKPGMPADGQIEVDAR